MINKKFLQILIIVFIIFFMIGGIFLFAFKNNDSQVQKIYNSWKNTYVLNLGGGMCRVINPQDNNVTVSEGIGYGLLFSVAMKDKETFDNLHNYMKLYLNSNGLMSWKVDSNGNIIGKGSATDADEDMAYAFLLAYSTWKDVTYLDEGKRIIQLIAKHEINSEYLVLPGDSWGDNYNLNPSYIAPMYYNKFAEVSDKNYWNKVLERNNKFLSSIMNKNTGLFPDWVNYKGTTNDNDVYGYDAVRVPIRLLQFYNKTKDKEALIILQREYNFISGIGANKLVAGYSLSGVPLVDYINSAYLSSFSAICFVDNHTNLSKSVLQKLILTQSNDYYGSSLKLWTMLILNGKI